ncbi:A24 family peptidase [Streptomyces sp. NPDC086777]|uniref:prepilin peptidase n=1 Tax=Streptomyces sp. NPDC086777 TaxID=3154866 RepID=UPI00345069FC
MTTALDLALPAAAALWGATAGSLLPRSAYRFSVPAGEEWRTSCPAGHPVRGWLGRAPCGDCATTAAEPAADEAVADGAVADGLVADGAVAEGAVAEGPVADGLVAEGPVADDGENTPPGPPAPTPLALATATVCTALALATGTRPELAVWLLLAPVGVLLAVVDFRVQRLPDPLTLPLAAAALALLGAAALLPEHAGDWLTSLYAALALGGAYFVLFLVNPAGMGFGDVKLALGTGAVLGWYGWPTVLLGTFAGFLLGALYGGALVVVRRAGRKTAIAFGPFLITGAFAGLLVGAYTA